MGNDNVISISADKITENEKVVRGGKEEAVKDGKIVDTTDSTALDLEKAKNQNYQIGQRIYKIREQAGLSSEQFYSLLYPDSNEADGTKRKRMSLIENAAAFDRDKDGEKIRGAILLDFPRLLFISQHFNVPLNYLLYGEAEPTAETPPVPQEKKETGKPTVRKFLQCVDELLKAPAIEDVHIGARNHAFLLEVHTRPPKDGYSFIAAKELQMAMDSLSDALKLPPYHMAKALTIAETIAMTHDVEISSDEKQKGYFRFRPGYDPHSPYERDHED